LEEPPQLKNVYLPGIFLLVFAFLMMLFPPFTAIFGIVAPVPIIFLSLQWGRGPGMILVALILGGLFSFMGPGQAMTFLVEYAVLALIMSESIRMRLDFDKCIFLSAVTSGILTVLLLFVLVGDDEKSLTEYFHQQVMEQFKVALEAAEANGENPAELQTVVEFAESVSRMIASSYPSFILVGTFIAAILNYALVRLLWIRLYGREIFSEKKFYEWVIPDPPIWLLISSSLLLVLAEGVMEAVALNIFVVMVFLYLLQGLAITIYYLKTRNVAVVFWVILFVVLLIQPIFMGLVAGIGVFDMWVDFRKLRRAEENSNG
jgi:uncharacterized protein YybS (DUF2232 family)